MARGNATATADPFVTENETGENTGENIENGTAVAVEVDPAKAAIKDANKAVLSEVTFTDEEPPAVGRASGSKFDKFRAELVANSGKWAKCAFIDTREGAQSKASTIRNSRAKWEGHAWDAKVSEAPEGSPAKFLLWVKHVSVGQPEPSERSVARAAALAAKNAENGSAAEVSTDPNADPFATENV